MIYKINLRIEMKKFNLIVIGFLLSIFMSGCGLKQVIQKGVSLDEYYKVDKNDDTTKNTFIESDYLIFLEINEKKLTNGAGIATGIGPRKIFLNPGVHTFKVVNGNQHVYTFKNINIEKDNHYFFGYDEESFWLKNETKNIVLYGYETIAD